MCTKFYRAVDKCFSRREKILSVSSKTRQFLAHPVQPFVVIVYIAHAQEIVNQTRCSVCFSHCIYMYIQVGTYIFNSFFLVNMRMQRGVVLCIYFVLIDIIYNKIGKNRYWGHIVPKVSAHVHFVGIRRYLCTIILNFSHVPMMLFCILPFINYNINGLIIFFNTVLLVD